MKRTVSPPAAEYDPGTSETETPTDASTFVG
jgi:hypothetical protein